MTTPPVDEATKPRLLGEHFAHLAGDGAVLEVPNDAVFWTERVAALPPGRLVSLLDSREDWSSWERHPHGEELILVLTGRLELCFDNGAQTWTERLEPHQFAVVPRGVWHTANVLEAGCALFITAGEGTENRQR